MGRAEAKAAEAEVVVAAVVAAVADVMVVVMARVAEMAVVVMMVVARVAEMAATAAVERGMVDNWADCSYQTGPHNAHTSRCHCICHHSPLCSPDRSSRIYQCKCSATILCCRGNRNLGC